MRDLFLFNITQSLFLDYALPILRLGLACQITFLFLHSGFGFATMGEYAKGGGTMVRDRGDGQDSIGCGRIRGRGFVWTLVGGHVMFLHVLCHTPTQKCHQSPTATISVSPPQEHQEAAPEDSTPAVKKSELALEVPSPAATEALEVAIPIHVTPLCLQLGGIKRVYKCWVEGCTRGHQLTCCYLHTCMQRALGGEVGMSLL